MTNGREKNQVYYDTRITKETPNLFSRNTKSILLLLLLLLLEKFTENKFHRKTHSVSN